MHEHQRERGLGHGVDLFRLRTAANGAGHQGLRRRERHAADPLRLRPARRAPPTAAGHRLAHVELCGTVGTNTTWNLYRDGVVIVNDWADEHRHRPRSAGSRSVTPPPRRSPPTSTTSCVDLVPGDEVGGARHQGPTTPGTPTGTSPSTSTIQISWTASTDASPPITYRIYRDGNPTRSVPATTTCVHRPRPRPGLEPHLHRRRRRLR